MNLNNLQPAAGSTQERKRIGRGPGSGLGGTSTRGHKGAKSRSGYHKKIGFDKNLIVKILADVVGVVVSHKPADAFDLFVGIASELSQKFSCDGGAFLLLHLTVLVTIFLFACSDADVVDEGRALKNELSLLVQTLFESDHRGVGVDFCCMLYSLRIAVIIFD
mgnify:CR=1 FL=1